MAVKQKRIYDHRQLPEICNTKEVAQYLGMHPKTIQALAREGKLPSSQPGGRKRLYNRDNVVAFANSTGKI